MVPSTTLAPRQLWNLPSSPSSSTSYAHCTPFTLPADGVLAFPNSTLTLTTDVVFIPQCTGDDFDNAGSASIADLRDPFYASVTPQVYVIAAATVIAWILVIMLIITPRTSFFGASAALPGFIQGQGIIGGANGGMRSLTGVGSRPWLQKVAALTVAISLTIATADTFQVAHSQYNTGFMDATAMRDEVIGSLEIRVTRVISDVFVWLAQVQTLIRLFPRHKEKILIKWIGFALIICDSTFSCLNSFLVNSTKAPRYFVDAIPALSYLFELALGLLYAAWVIYYAITKRRYAFYHHKMKSISLIALLSLIAILTPVVFFVTDVSNSDLASWGDYFRWVGAAAASVVVWEWVERIEAIERDEKKDGILGREIFDGDDMLDDVSNDDVVWRFGRRNRFGHGRIHHTSDERRDSFASAHRVLGNKLRNHGRPTVSSSGYQSGSSGGDPDRTRQHDGSIAFVLPRGGHQGQQADATDGITPPPLVASPISRTDTSSAGSIIYIVRPDPAADVPQPIRRRAEHGIPKPRELAATAAGQSHASADNEKTATTTATDSATPQSELDRNHNRWFAVANPFKRKRVSPPAEVQMAQREAIATADFAVGSVPRDDTSRSDLKDQLGLFAAGTGGMFRDRAKRSANHRVREDEQRTIVIPAQPRGSGRTWSPAALATNRDSPNRPQQNGGLIPQDSRVRNASTGRLGNDATSLSSPLPSDSPVRSEATRTTNDRGGSHPPGANLQSVTTSVPIETQNHVPPRADDVSPSHGSGDALIVVPAPPRTSPINRSKPDNDG